MNDSDAQPRKKSSESLIATGPLQTVHNEDQGIPSLHCAGIMFLGVPWLGSSQIQTRS